MCACVWVCVQAFVCVHVRGYGCAHACGCAYVCLYVWWPGDKLDCYLSGAHYFFFPFSF